MRSREPGATQQEPGPSGRPNPPSAAELAKRSGLKNPVDRFAVWLLAMLGKVDPHANERQLLKSAQAFCQNTIGAPTPRNRRERRAVRAAIRKMVK